MASDVQGKSQVGYNTTITDYWGRGLSYQLVNTSDGGLGESNLDFKSRGKSSLTQTKRIHTLPLRMIPTLRQEMLPCPSLLPTKDLPANCSFQATRRSLNSTRGRWERLIRLPMLLHHFDMSAQTSVKGPLRETDHALEDMTTLVSSWERRLRSSTRHS